MAVSHDIRVLVRTKQGEISTVVAPDLGLYLNPKEFLSADEKEKNLSADEKESKFPPEHVLTVPEQIQLAGLLGCYFNGKSDLVLNIVAYNNEHQSINDKIAQLKAPLTRALQSHIDTHHISELDDLPKWDVKENGSPYLWISIPVNLPAEKCNTRCWMPPAVTIFYVLNLALSEYFDYYFNLANGVAKAASLTGVIADFGSTFPEFIMSKPVKNLLGIFHSLYQACCGSGKEPTDGLEKDFEINQMKGKLAYSIVGTLFIILACDMGVRSWSDFNNRINVLTENYPESSFLFMLLAKTSYWLDASMTEFLVPLSLTWEAAMLIKSYADQFFKKPDSSDRKPIEAKDEAREVAIAVRSADEAAPLIRRRRTWCSWFGGSDEQEQISESQYNRAIPRR